MNTDKITDITSIALSKLPIHERLEFVKNIIFDRGGDKDSDPVDPSLVTAVEVLRGVIDTMRAQSSFPRLQNDS